MRKHADIRSLERKIHPFWSAAGTGEKNRQPPPVSLLPLIMAGIVLVLSALSIGAWIASALGWSAHRLYQWLPDTVTQKPITSLTFFIQSAGLMLIFRGHRRTGRMLGYLSFACVAYSLLPYFGWDVPLFEQGPAAYSYAPGVPSLGTISAFVLVAFALAGMCMVVRRRRVRFVLGLTIAAIGAVALLGYMTARPLLYYQIEGLSTAMALSTALFFIHIGEAIKSWSGYSLRSMLSTWWQQYQARPLA